MINFSTVYESLKPLKGAVEAISGDSVVVVHVPGFGAVLSSSSYGDVDLGTMADKMKSVLFGLAGLVKGLSSKEVICLALHFEDYSDKHNILIVKMSPGDPGTLEVLINGKPGSRG